MKLQKNLAKWPYENLWIPVQKAAQYLETKDTEECGTFVKKIGGSWDSTCVILVPKGGRCPCRKRISHVFQCKEKYAIDKRFILDKYDSMRLQEDIYRLNDRRVVSTLCTNAQHHMQWDR